MRPSLTQAERNAGSLVFWQGRQSRLQRQAVLGGHLCGGLQILLYVGGVTVLLLFAVMLTTRDTMRVELFRAACVAPVVGILAVFLLRTYEGVHGFLTDMGHVPAEPEPTTEHIGNLFLSPDGYLIPFQVVAVLLLLVLIGAVTVARRGQGSAT